MIDCCAGVPHHAVRLVGRLYYLFIYNVLHFFDRFCHLRGAESQIVHTSGVGSGGFGGWLEGRRKRSGGVGGRWVGDCFTGDADKLLTCVGRLAIGI
jgi:hypothetical protein